MVLSKQEQHIFAQEVTNSRRGLLQKPPNSNQITEILEKTANEHFSCICSLNHTQPDVTSWSLNPHCADKLQLAAVVCYQWGTARQCHKAGHKENQSSLGQGAFQQNSLFDQLVQPLSVQGRCIFLACKFEDIVSNSLVIKLLEESTAQLFLVYPCKMTQCNSCYIKYEVQ